MGAYAHIDATLPALAAVKDKPGYGEPASDLWECIQQTRVWLLEYLHNYFGTGADVLQPAAFTGATLNPASIRGTNLVDASEREIKQGTITNFDILAGSLFDKNFAKGSITEDRLATLTDSDATKDGTIPSDKLQPGVFTLPSGERVSSKHLQNKAITAVKLKADANGVLGAVTKRALQKRAVGGVQLPAGGLNTWLVGGFLGSHGVTNCLAPVSITAPFTMTSEGVVTMNESLGFMRYGVVTLGPAAMPTLAAGWNVLPPYNYRFADFPVVARHEENEVELSPYHPDSFTQPYNNGQKICFTKDGSYLIFVRVGGLRTDGLVMKAFLRLDGNWVAGKQQTFRSTAADSGNGAAYASCACFLSFIVQVANTGVDYTLKPYIQLSAYCTAAANATLGYWLPRTATEKDEVFSTTVTILKLL